MVELVVIHLFLLGRRRKNIEWLFIADKWAIITSVTAEIEITWLSYEIENMCSR